MSPRRRLAIAASSLAALSLLAGACGDDPAEPGAGAPSESTLPSSDDAPTGTGSLTIGGETFPFDADVCSLEPVRHVGRDYQVYVHGTGGTDDAPYEIEVTHTISGSGNLIETITMDPGDNRLAGATSSPRDGEEPQLSVSSSLLEGEMEFVGTDDVPIGTGTINVACA